MRRAVPAGDGEDVVAVREGVARHVLARVQQRRLLRVRVRVRVKVRVIGFGLGLALGLERAAASPAQG